MLISRTLGTFGLSTLDTQPGVCQRFCPLPAACVGPATAALPVERRCPQTAFVRVVVAEARTLELPVFLDLDRAGCLAPPRPRSEGVAVRPVGRALAPLERVRGGDAFVYKGPCTNK